MKKHLLLIAVVIVAYFVGATWPSAASYVKGKIGL